MKCNKCEAENPDYAKFCHKCGDRLDLQKVADAKRGAASSTTWETAVTPPPRTPPNPPPPPTPPTPAVDTATPATPVTPVVAPDPEPPSWPPPRPTALTVLGIIAIILGLIMSPMNAYGLISSTMTLKDIGGAEAMMLIAQAVSGSWLVLSLLLLLSGIGMVCGKPWARRLALAAAIASFPLIPGGLIATEVAGAVLRAQGGPTRSFEVFIGGACFMPLFSVALLVYLLSGNVRRWAKITSAGPGVDQAALFSGPETNMLAVSCLLLSFLPALPLLIGSVITGVIALRQIGRSEGKQRGKGMAIVGLMISGFWMLLVVGLIVLGIVLFSTGVIK
jgi:zinc-ribbon domain